VYSNDYKVDDDNSTIIIIIILIQQFIERIIALSEQLHCTIAATNRAYEDRYNSKIQGSASHSMVLLFLSPHQKRRSTEVLNPSVTVKGVTYRLPASA